MRAREAWRQSLAMMAAIAGTGLIPGRAIAFFFGQLKSTAWLGVCMASLLFGSLTAGMAWCAQKYGSQAFSREGALFQLWDLLRGLFASLLTSIMLVRAGEIGALALPLRHGYAFGSALALTAAALLCLNAERLFPGVGLAVSTVTALFFAALALDPRPIRLLVHIETEFRLAGQISSAVLLAVLFAAMNACAAGMMALRPCAGSPLSLGARNGGMLFAVLTLGCMALNRGGDALLAQPEPWVLLSARWGIAGFWICAGVEYLCAFCSLAAALQALLLRLRAHRGRWVPALFPMLISAVLYGALSCGRL